MDFLAPALQRRVSVDAAVAAAAAAEQCANVDAVAKELLHFVCPEMETAQRLCELLDAASAEARDADGRDDVEEVAATVAEAFDGHQVLQRRIAAAAAAAAAGSSDASPPSASDLEARTELTGIIIDGRRSLQLQHEQRAALCARIDGILEDSTITKLCGSCDGVLTANQRQGAEAAPIGEMIAGAPSLFAHVARELAATQRARRKQPVAALAASLTGVAEAAATLSRHAATAAESLSRGESNDCEIDSALAALATALTTAMGSAEAVPCGRTPAHEQHAAQPGVDVQHAPEYLVAWWCSPASPRRRVLELISALVVAARELQARQHAALKACAGHLLHIGENAALTTVAQWARPSDMQREFVGSVAALLRSVASLQGSSSPSHNAGGFQDIFATYVLLWGDVLSSVSVCFPEVLPSGPYDLLKSLRAELLEVHAADADVPGPSLMELLLDAAEVLIGSYCNCHKASGKGSSIALTLRGESLWKLAGLLSAEKQLARYVTRTAELPRIRHSNFAIPAIMAVTVDEGVGELGTAVPFPHAQVEFADVWSEGVAGRQYESLRELWSRHTGSPAASYTQHLIRAIVAAVVKLHKRGIVLGAHLDATTGDSSDALFDCIVVCDASAATTADISIGFRMRSERHLLLPAAMVAAAAAAGTAAAAAAAGLRLRDLQCVCTLVHHLAFHASPPLVDFMTMADAVTMRAEQVAATPSGLAKDAIGLAQVLSYIDNTLLAVAPDVAATTITTTFAQSASAGGAPPPSPSQVLEEDANSHPRALAGLEANSGRGPTTPKLTPRCLERDQHLAQSKRRCWKPLEATPSASCDVSRELGLPTGPQWAGSALLLESPPPARSNVVVVESDAIASAAKVPPLELAPPTTPASTPVGAAAATPARRTPCGGTPRGTPRMLATPQPTLSQPPPLTPVSMSRDELDRLTQLLLAHCDCGCKNLRRHGFRVVGVEEVNNRILWHAYEAKKEGLRLKHEGIAGRKGGLPHIPRLDHPQQDGSDRGSGCCTMTSVPHALSAALAAELPLFFSDVLGDSFNVNELYLLHGTSHASAELIARQGFDERLASHANGTLFGEGTYFTNAICKSHTYSKVDPAAVPQEHRNSAAAPKERFVLLSRVLLGSPYVARDKMPRLRRPPQDVAVTIDSVIHDSVIGNGRMHKEFVIYDRTQAYPFCLIRYISNDVLL